jgi:DNA-binding beta-propeller fold protein YncE
LLPARSVADSPDGRNVYVSGSPGSNAVALFDRDPATGELTQKAGLAACVSETGTGGVCADGVAMTFVDDLVVSPDGRNLYVVANSSDAVVVFDRDVSTGALTQKAGLAGCISETGTTGACTDGVALDGISGIAISPDGRSVYTAANLSSAIAVFDRNPATGALTQKAGLLGCVSETGTMGACADGVALSGVTGVAASPEGNVYAVSGSSDAVVVFDRDASTGALTQKAGLEACISETGTAGTCMDGVGLDAARSVKTSPDGSAVYVVSAVDDAIAVFDRAPATGVLTQMPGLEGCIGEVGGECADGRGLDAPQVVDVSSDGRSVYVASSESSAVAVLTTVPAAYDIDGDGDLQSLTDALLLLRYMFGLTAGSLINGAVDLIECTRCTAPQIESHLESLDVP